jgi:integrase
MNRYNYSSAIASNIKAFIEFKASVGIASNSRNWTLFDFDRWCIANNTESLDKNAVEGWVTERKSKTSSDHLSWMSHIRELGRFMRANGHPDAYVLSDEFKAKMVRVAPYLLTQSEVDAFFTVAAHLKAKSPWEWQAVCFFGLMHSCGLRTCEARRLRRCDVDTDGLVIDVMWSKGNRSRRLVITDEVATMLKKCDDQSLASFGADRPAFFVSAAGNPVASCTVGVVFRHIWSEAGLPDTKGGKRPHPYIFRHRFAYANIERWRAEGADTGAQLPYLSRYMGHASFDSTYYYVHTSPDFLSDYAGIIRQTEALLPEVGFDV